MFAPQSIINGSDSRGVQNDGNSSIARIIDAVACSFSKNSLKPRKLVF
jgi:hypothetical protein